MTESPKEQFEELFSLMKETHEQQIKNKKLYIMFIDSVIKTLKQGDIEEAIKSLIDWKSNLVEIWISSKEND